MGVTNETTMTTANKELKETMEQHKIEGKKVQRLEDL
jgi:hypothetical protein